MGDTQERCHCDRPDVTVLEMCQGCGNPTNLEDLRQRAVDTYDRDGQPIEDPDLPRRHLRMGDPRTNLRVLHLNDSTSHILSGTFECVSTAHLPPYEAVSYTWGGDDGDYSKSEFIIINGKVFPITKNCAAALRKIRKQRGTRVIWIDSLCINQNDVNERSTQVSEMSKIYSGAQKVHIYLGSNIDDMTASKASFVLSSTTSLEEVQESLRIDKDVLKAVQTFFAQPYFSRIWIVQEVLLAKTTKIHWGTATAPWQMFSNEYLKKLGECGMLTSIPEWMHIRISNQDFRKSEALGELLFGVMGCKASDDRDKVYGIYGLLFDSEKEGLTVDYSLSVKQVYTNMAAHLITRHNALRAVLERAHDQAPLANGEHLPSWVPDFRSKCLPRSLSTSFDSVEIRFSISPNDVVSSCGMDGLCLRGHRLRNLQDKSEAGQLDSEIIRRKVVGLEGEWELEAYSSITFDQKDDTVFWASNGLFLHLRKHLTIKGAFTFLGPYRLCLRHLSPKPANSRTASFPGGKFGVEFLDLQHLKLLWKFHTEMESILQYGSVWRGSTPTVFPGLDADSQNVTNFQDFWGNKETWETLHKLSTISQHPESFDIQNISMLCQSWLQYDDEFRHLFERYLATDDEERALRREILKQLEAWERTTEKLLEALQWTERHFWPYETAPADYLWYYEEMGWSLKPDQRAYEWDCDGDANTEDHEVKSSSCRKKVMRWIKGLLWPSRSLPSAWTGSQDKRRKVKVDEARDTSCGNQTMPGRLIKYKFRGLRSNFKRRPVAWGYWGYQLMLQPWDGSWANVIRLIPYLLAIRDRFSCQDLITLRSDCENFRMWKMAEVEMCPAEIITLL